ncbi:MAG: DNA-directed polymerase sigma-70 factor [Herbinix sp.]|jgi:RNA polymerase sigma-70 factor (ECF subfamily)|nr:DNA-directed polymerase sigma-70 factor [Herbinix sp.]
MEDYIIIKRLKQNKEKALEYLIERYSSYVVSIAARIGGRLLSIQDVEEIASDVFYAIWKNRGNLIETGSLKPYIAQIARNMTKTRLCHKREEEPLDEDMLVFSSEGVDELIIHKEQLQFLRDTISLLNYPDKDILLSYYFWNYKLTEIAERFDLPLSTIKSKLYRGRSELVKRFEEGGYYYEA